MFNYKNNLFLSCLFVFTGLFFSCSEEELPEPLQPEGEIVEVEFRLGVEENEQIITRSGNLSEEGDGLNMLFTADDIIQTRAVGVENRIESVWVFQFENTGSDYDRLLKKVKVDNLRQEGTDGKPVYILKAELKKSDNCQLFFVANGLDSDFTPMVEEVATIHVFQSIPGYFMEMSSFDNIPMTAFYKGAIPVLDPDATVWMYRVLAKLSLTLVYDNLPAGYSLALKSAQLISVPFVFQYYDEGRYSSSSWIFPDAIGTTDDFSLITGPLSSGTTLTWYMPENRRGINSSVTNQKNKYQGTVPFGGPATYVLLKGSYSTPAETYNVAISLYPGGNITSDFNIIRNTHYKMTADFRSLAKDDYRITKIMQ